MTQKILLETTRKAILNGSEFTIHKAVGSIRKNCRFAVDATEIPDFLLHDGAVEINSDGTVTLHAVEGPATRSFPVYICWEEASAQNSDKVPGMYGAWPKDNGAETLSIVDGVCYNLPAMVKASILSDVVPEWVMSAGFPVSRKGDDWTLIRTDWGGDVRTGHVGVAFWCEYAPGDVNILSLAERSASEYTVSVDGTDVALLTELFPELLA